MSAIIVSLNPSCFAPEFLKRPTLVILQPPAAEEVLQANEGDTQEEACGVAAILIQTKAPTIEQHRTKDGLRHVVG